MNEGVAINFARGRLQDPRPQQYRQVQYVDCTVDTRLRRLYGVPLIVNRRSRTGEIVDLINVEMERENHIVAYRLEPRI
jgi:hypothetical protein